MSLGSHSGIVLVSALAMCQSTPSCSQPSTSCYKVLTNSSVPAFPNSAYLCCLGVKAAPKAPLRLTILLDKVTLGLCTSGTDRVCPLGKKKGQRTNQNGYVIPPRQKRNPSRHAPVKLTYKQRTRRYLRYFTRK